MTRLGNRPRSSTSKNLVLVRERAKASVHLSMAVRAQHDALPELGFNLVPRARDPFLGHAERLRIRVDVMEVEDRRCTIPAAQLASSAHERNCAFLSRAPMAHHRMPGVLPIGGVPEAMTICADEDAFVGFGEKPVPAAREAAYAEQLVACLSVMEFQGSEASVVLTVLAPSSAKGYETLLEPTAALALVADDRSDTSPPCGWPQSARNGGWRLRRVVRAEWRARQAEAASIERASLAVDRLLCEEEGTARFAGLLADRSRSSDTRISTWSVRTAGQTEAPTVKVPRPALQDLPRGKAGTAADASESHGRTLVLGPIAVKPQLRQRS